MARQLKPFRAWDGEAVAGKYVMLLSSDGHRVVRPDGIGTVEAFDCLLAAGQNAINVGFVFSYDVNMILGDLEPADAIYLWSRGMLDWNGYRIRYRNRKEFSVRKGNRYCRVWDTFGFFQSSFVRAVETWLPDIDLTELERMKGNRPDFTMDQLPEIERYCKRECDLLVEVMDRLRDAAAVADITLSRWDGAGAVAASLLRDHNVREYSREPAAVADIGRAAFYGGRIECVRFGHYDGPVYTYDVRSAYPAALTVAPCLHCGKWEVDSGHWTGNYSLHRVKWELEGRALPFPWRDREGAVYFPGSGRGWYWQAELNAAMAALDLGLIRGMLTVEMSAVYTPGCEHKPFSWVPQLYATRAAWKRDGNAAEKPLKLGLNSLYGKTAQRVGGRRGAPPPFHNMLWAGFVTSYTRAALYRASFGALRQDALIAFATDAVFSTVPLDVDCGPQLGQWESTRHETATIVQSGVYWLGQGAETVEHTRGFLRGEFSRADATEAWSVGRWAVERSVQRFRGIGSALVLKQGRWREWVAQSRTLKLEPTGTKRRLPPGTRLAGIGRLRPDLGLVATLPADTREQQLRSGIDSNPIAVPWAHGAGWGGTGWDVWDQAEDESESGWY